MSFTYDQFRIDNWADTVRLQAQQKLSKLEENVLSRDDVSAETDHWDRLGSVEAKKQTNRFAKIVFNELPHSRRQVVLATYRVDIPISHADVQRMKADPTDRYVQATVAALNRKKDEVVIRAGLGNATSVDRTNNGAKTLVPLPATQIILAGGAGLTQDKADNAYEIIVNNDVDDEDLFAVISQRQVRNLFNEAGSKVVSRDFNISQPMINGKIIGKWAGFSWIVSNRLDKVGNDRQCMFYAKPGIGFSYNMKSIRVDIKDRPDLEDTAQISSVFDGEATRIEEEMVVRVDCQETAP